MVLYLIFLRFTIFRSLVPYKCIRRGWRKIQYTGVLGFNWNLMSFAFSADAGMPDRKLSDPGVADERMPGEQT